MFAGGETSRLVCGSCYGTHTMRDKQAKVLYEYAIEG